MQETRRNASATDWNAAGWLAGVRRRSWLRWKCCKIREISQAWHQRSGASLKIHRETEDSARLLRRCGSGGAGSAATARNLLVSLGLLLGEGRDWNTAEQVRLGGRSEQQPWIGAVASGGRSFVPLVLCFFRVKLPLLLFPLLVFSLYRAYCLSEKACILSVPPPPLSLSVPWENVYPSILC